MKTAFPLVNENELAIDFAHSKFIVIFDDAEMNTQLIPLTGIEKELGILNFFDLMVTYGLHSVVSPFYSYMALRVFRENNIETYKAEGTNLAQNISSFKTKKLDLFNVYESLLIGECAKSCSSCRPSCSEN